MRLLRQMALGTLTTAGAGYLIYRFILNDKAKQHVHKAADAVRGSYERLNRMVEDATGAIMAEDDEALPNRKKTLQQWADLGY